MIQFDHATGTLVLPIWGSAALAAVFVALAVIAVVRTGAIRTAFAIAILGLAGYAAWIGSSFVDRVGAGSASNHRFDERRAFELRAQDLVARAFAPGSTLSCLDDTAGEQVAQGCEKVLFGSPESVSAAVSYVHARLSLLVDGLDAASRGDDMAYEATLSLLRRGLEVDRFGIVAHVFLQLSNCTPEQCEALALLRDPNKVRVNLQEKTFDALVARHSPTWSQPRTGPVAEMPKLPAGNGTTASTSAATGTPVASKYDFPSSNSIPPVSIMNTEPAASPPSASTTASAPAQQSGPREPRRPPGVRHAAPAPRNEAAPAPVQLAPSAAPPASPSRPGAQ
jgi:hypothetical protein